MYVDSCGQTEGATYVNRMEGKGDSVPKKDDEPDPEDEFAYGDPYEGQEWDNDDMYVDLCSEINARRDHAAADCPPTPDVDPKRDDYSHVDLLAQFNDRCNHDPHDFMKKSCAKFKAGRKSQRALEMTPPALRKMSR